MKLLQANTKGLNKVQQNPEHPALCVKNRPGTGAHRTSLENLETVTLIASAVRWKMRIQGQLTEYLEFPYLMFFMLLKFLPSMLYVLKFN